MLTLLILVVLLALLNRVRGGGFYGDRLPGHPRFWVAPVVALLSLWAGLDWPWAIFMGIAYLAWSLPPWGFLQCLERHPAWKQPEPFERTLLRLCGGSTHWAFFARHLICSAPLLLLPGLYAWPFALALFALGSYEFGWRRVPLNPIQAGELSVGACWGLIIYFAGTV